jgi:hypothetical protein
MFRTTTLAAAAVAALALPAFAAAPKPPMAHPPQTAHWYIIQSVASGVCYVTDRRAGLDEAQVSGAYRTESQAEVALGSNLPCRDAAGGNSPAPSFRPT